jgi:cytochrome c oxidase subunit II
VGKLFAGLVAIITVVATYVFVARIWWMPPDISTIGPAIDSQLIETMFATGVLFVAAQFSLAWFVLRSGDDTNKRPVKAFPGGATPLVIGACVLVGFEILGLTLVGSKIWSSIFLTPAPADALVIDTQAGQFAFYFRYAGPDGKFGVPHPDKIDEGGGNYFGLDPATDTAARDDIVAAELAVPVNRPVELTLHSKDVGHAFFVPELRLQQDFVPGLDIPIHFTATKIGKTEIVCTQLCGLGHYNMRTYLEVMSDSAFAKWLKDQAGQ